jgi:hypothetical protein
LFLLFLLVEQLVLDLDAIEVAFGYGGCCCCCCCCLVLVEAVMQLVAVAMVVGCCCCCCCCCYFRYHQRRSPNHLSFIQELKDYGFVIHPPPSSASDA